MATSPTENSLKLMRRLGYQAQVTEKWNPHAKVRQDLFGFVDIVAVGNGHTVGIQTTTKKNISSRRNKILASPLLQPLLAAGWQIVVHGWAKNAKGRWELKEEQITA